MSLRRYYFEILMMGIPANFNLCTIKYCLRTFTLKQNLGLIFGFDQILKVYIRNMANAGKIKRKMRRIKEYKS